MITPSRHYSTPIKQRTKFTCPPQFITTLPDTTTFHRRRRAQLIVKVAGTPQPTVKWMLNNVLLRDNERIHITSSHDGRHKLVIDDVSDSDAGLYTVFAFNAIDETITDTYVSVEDGPPIVSTLFTSIDLEVDDKLCLVVCVKDYGDDYNVKWFRNKLPISKHVDGIAMTKKRHLCSLKISSVRIKDGGVYRCAVTSGKETSVRFNVSVTDPEVKVCPRTKQSNGMKVNTNWNIKALDHEDNVHCIPVHVFFKTQQQQQQHSQQHQQQEPKQHPQQNMKRCKLKRSKSFNHISESEMDEEELNCLASSEFSLWTEDKTSSGKISRPQSRSVSLEDILDYNLISTNAFSYVQQKKKQQLQLQKQQQQPQDQLQPQTYTSHEPTFRIKETTRSNSCCIARKARSPLEKAKEAIRKPGVSEIMILC